MACARQRSQLWSQACLRPARQPRAVSRARWWQVVLLALVFASLHSGLTAAWAAWQGQTLWVQVCTAEGMRWVAGDDSQQETPAVLKQGCVWMSAALAIPSPPPVQMHWALRVAHPAPIAAVHREPPLDTPRRVLLMAPMRAPPERV